MPLYPTLWHRSRDILCKLLKKLIFLPFLGSKMISKIRLNIHRVIGTIKPFIRHTL